MGSISTGAEEDYDHTGILTPDKYSVKEIGTAAHTELLIQGKKHKDVFDRYFKNPYFQHNPSLPLGTTAVKAWKEKHLIDVDVTFYRILVEGDIIVIHQTMEGFPPMPDAFAIDVYRLRDGKIVEHWDGIEPASGGLTSKEQLAGPTEIVDIDKTEINRTLVRNFVREVLIDGKHDKFSQYVADDLIQHDPMIGQGLSKLVKYVKTGRSTYKRFSRIVCEGNFAWTFCEGTVSSGGSALYVGGFNGEPSILYDLWRVENEKIVEHWRLKQGIPTETASGLPVLFE